MSFSNVFRYSVAACDFLLNYITHDTIPSIQNELKSKFEEVMEQFSKEVLMTEKLFDVSIILILY